MNTTDLLTQWSTLSLDEIEAELAKPSSARTARKLYGAQSVRQMRRPAAARAVRALPGTREAVVLLPGIMGSLLSSIRGVTELLWINPFIFLNGHADYLELSPDGARDANPAIEAVPVGIEKLVYLKMALALRRETELFEFPYDWRRPVEANADVLHACLERWAAGAAGKQFTLVGHSMGGIVARAYLARHPAAAERRIKRVISLGTPYFGAANAIENIVLGNEMMEIAGKLNAGNQTKSILLNMPSLYELLPAPADLFPAGRDYPANWDLYNASAWQFAGIRPDYLALGRRFHASLAAAQPQVETIQIAGCNLETTVDVRRTFGAGDQVQFERIRQDRGPDAGDGTVPLWSAMPPGARLYFIQERHRYLPDNAEVIKAVLELAHDGAADLPTAIPPRKAGLLGRRGAAAPAALDVRAAELRERLENGTATEEDLALLYFAV